jgi:hypothetical protein
MNSTELDGNVIGVYESLAEAQHEMNENFEESVDFYGDLEHVTTKHDVSMNLTTPYGYAITYYISLNPNA